MPNPTVARFTYRAFISYSHRDKAWADWLHKALETYRVPSRLVGTTTAHGTIPRRLIPVFRDREELSSSPELGTKINEALAQSENLIVICSPASADSHWVNQEVLAYKRIGRAARIFCMIVDGEPNATDLPGRASEECFCPALRFATDANGRPTNERTEPIAADARAGKDGKPNAKLKLISGMLDVGFDALKQREQRRQLQRMTAIASLALVVMAVTIVLAIAALVSRHRAVIAQHEAVVAKQAAVRRQKQAEGLVGFMLGDLNDKLDQVHRLDIMQAVDDKALAYFRSLPIADATDAALAMRVTALEKIASVRMDQGKIPQAREAYRAASQLAAELARREPHNAARQGAWGDSLKWVGLADWYQGDLTAALKNFRAAGRLLQQAHASLPANDDLAFDLATARNNAGHVLETRGDFAAAQDDYEATLALYRQLAAREPANPKWQSYMGDAWDNLGKLALERGHLGEAITAYRKDQAIKAVLASRTPGDHQAQENLLISNAILGRTLALCGDLSAALRYTGQAVEIAKRLTSFDASESEWHKFLALYGQQLGGLLRQTAQIDAAATADSNAVRVLETLVKKDSTNTDWQQDLAQAKLEYGRLQLQRGLTSAANASATAALGALESLHAKDADNRNLILLTAQGETLLGQIAARGNDMAAARADWQRARNMIVPAARIGDDPNFLAAWATTLLLLRDDAAAQAPLAKLAAMAYRSPDLLALLEAKHIHYAPDVVAHRRIVASIQSAEP